VQVIPIYGRGGDNTDPRQKVQALGEKEEDKDGPIPRRPPGQRVAPMPVCIELFQQGDKMTLYFNEAG
jgi:hypothetical protein